MALTLRSRGTARIHPRAAPQLNVSPSMILSRGAEVSGVSGGSWFGAFPPRLALGGDAACVHSCTSALFFVLGALFQVLVCRVLRCSSRLCSVLFSVFGFGVAASSCSSLLVSVWGALFKILACRVLRWGSFMCSLSVLFWVLSRRFGLCVSGRRSNLTFNADWREAASRLT
jgi:hypothetical protein